MLRCCPVEGRVCSASLETQQRLRRCRTRGRPCSTEDTCAQLGDGTLSPLADLQALGGASLRDPQPPAPPRCLQAAFLAPALVRAPPDPPRDLLRRPPAQLYTVRLAGERGVALPGGEGQVRHGSDKGPTGPALGACGLFRPSRPAAGPRPARRGWRSRALSPTGVRHAPRPHEGHGIPDPPRWPRVPTPRVSTPRGTPALPHFSPSSSLAGYGSLKPDGEKAACLTRAPPGPPTGAPLTPASWPSFMGHGLAAPSLQVSGCGGEVSRWEDGSQRGGGLPQLHPP